MFIINFLAIIFLTIENNSIKCYFKIYYLKNQKGGKKGDEEEVNWYWDAYGICAFHFNGNGCFRCQR